MTRRRFAAVGTAGLGLVAAGGLGWLYSGGRRREEAVFGACREAAAAWTTDGAMTSGSMRGRICMVTGATSGIGDVTARELARLGALVVVVGRDDRKCARQVDRIQEDGGRAEALVADLSSQAQVRRLVAEFASRHRHLDVLVNNAAAYFSHRQLSVDGLEMTFALNHLSYFMLTLLLMEPLMASAAARIVNVASVAHEGRVLDFDDLQGERSYERLEAYGRSKLAVVLFTYELARRLEGTRVTANALHPGTVKTSLGRDKGWLRMKVANLVKRGMLTPEQGARTSIHLASSPAVEGVSGRYFQDCREARSSPASYDEAVAARLWRVSEELTGVRWSAALPRSVPSRTSAGTGGDVVSATE